MSKRLKRSWRKALVVLATMAVLAGGVPPPQAFALAFALPACDNQSDPNSVWSNGQPINYGSPVTPGAPMSIQVTVADYASHGKCPDSPNSTVYTLYMALANSSGGQITAPQSYVLYSGAGDPGVGHFPGINYTSPYSGTHTFSFEAPSAPGTYYVEASMVETSNWGASTTYDATNNAQLASWNQSSPPANGFLVFNTDEPQFTVVVASHQLIGEIQYASDAPLDGDCAELGDQCASSTGQPSNTLAVQPGTAIDLHAGTTQDAGAPASSVTASFYPSGGQPMATVQVGAASPTGSWSEWWTDNYALSSAFQAGQTYTVIYTATWPDGTAETATVYLEILAPNQPPPPPPTSSPPPPGQTPVASCPAWPFEPVVQSAGGDTWNITTPLPYTDLGSNLPSWQAWEYQPPTVYPVLADGALDYSYPLTVAQGMPYPFGTTSVSASNWFGTLTATLTAGQDNPSLSASFAWSGALRDPAGAQLLGFQVVVQGDIVTVSTSYEFNVYYKVPNPGWWWLGEQPWSYGYVDVWTPYGDPTETQIQTALDATLNNSSAVPISWSYVGQTQAPSGVYLANDCASWSNPAYFTCSAFQLPLNYTFPAGPNGDWIASGDTSLNWTLDAPYLDGLRVDQAQADQVGAASQTLERAPGIGPLSAPPMGSAQSLPTNNGGDWYGGGTGTFQFGGGYFDGGIAYGGEANNIYPTPFRFNGSNLWTDNGSPDYNWVGTDGTTGVIGGEIHVPSALFGDRWVTPGATVGAQVAATAPVLGCPLTATVGPPVAQFSLNPTVNAYSGPNVTDAAGVQQQYQLQDWTPPGTSIVRHMWVIWGPNNNAGWTAWAPDGTQNLPNWYQPVDQAIPTTDETAWQDGTAVAGSAVNVVPQMSGRWPAYTWSSVGLDAANDSFLVAAAAPVTIPGTSLQTYQTVGANGQPVDAVPIVVRGTMSYYVTSRAALPDVFQTPGAYTVLELAQNNLGLWSEPYIQHFSVLPPPAPQVAISATSPVQVGQNIGYDPQIISLPPGDTIVASRYTFYADNGQSWAGTDFAGAVVSGGTLSVGTVTGLPQVLNTPGWYTVTYQVQDIYGDWSNVASTQIQVLDYQLTAAIDPAQASQGSIADVTADTTAGACRVWFYANTDAGGNPAGVGMQIISGPSPPVATLDNQGGPVYLEDTSGNGSSWVTPNPDQNGNPQWAVDLPVGSYQIPVSAEWNCLGTPVIKTVLVPFSVTKSKAYVVPTVTGQD